MRFCPTPPQPPWSSELLWVLNRAFSRDLPALPVGAPSQALNLARRLELSGRIAARLGRERCWAELGEPCGDELYEDFLTNVAAASALQAAQDRVQVVAARHDIPIVWLKFAGLRAAGLVRVGSRIASDLDVLAPEPAARRLWEALRREAQLQTYGARSYEHQLEALADRAGAVVELHTMLPGVLAPSGRFLRWQELSQLGQLRQVTYGSQACQVPKPAIMAAHALAHGLLQNAAAPQAYSPLRMLGDLLDLRTEVPNAVLEAGQWLDARVGEAGAFDAERLCRVLADASPTALRQESSELLRHCLAARLDADYAASLRRQGWRRSLTERAAWVGFPSRVFWLLFPTRLELDALYGPATKPWRRVSRRLARPLAVVRRLFRPSSRTR